MTSGFNPTGREVAVSMTSHWFLNPGFKSW